MSSHLVVAVVGVERPEAGGAHNAETLMLGQIRKSLNNNEIIIIEPRKKYAGPYEDFKRLSGFLRSLYLLWKSNPVIWSLSWRFPWIPPSKFERDLLRKKVDIVFFVGIYDRAIELKKIPFIATIWDLGHRDLPALPEMSRNRGFELREWRIKNVAMKAMAIVVDSEVTKSKLHTYYGIDNSKIHSLPFAPNVGEVLPQGERESFALYPAHFWSHKNHIVLFNGIARLVEEGKKPRQLKLTGLDRGNLKFLIEKTEELGIHNYVEFLGFIPQSELHSMFQKAGIVVMPSLLGPTNFPPLESLLNGCPVAVTPQARENLGNWHGVIELNGNDIQAWSNVLDLDSSFEKVDVQMIQTHVSEAAALNVNKLISIFNNFSAMKNTYA